MNNKILKSQKIYPNAKLNLYLEIIGQREDGYHLLETLMVPISLYDEIDIIIYDEGDIIVETINLDIAQSENIIYKVLIRAKKEFNLNFGAKIIVNKKIPSGAGLGGGSSDAAFVLKFLNELLKFATTQELIEFSSKIGADIPFFIINKPSFCEGIGDIINIIDIEKIPLYLCIPNYHVNTAKIFQNRAKFIPESELFGSSISNNKPYIWNHLKDNNKLFFNKLTKSVKLIEPNLFKIIENNFKQYQLYLTGTGSCFYTSTENKELLKVEIL
jgi:4-diphosphocytidyl-2-C-methyl-D-erythritol kinase